MITLDSHKLTCRFPEVHPEAALTLKLQRTLRIPDDGKDYPLPPALGAFPVEHVEDHADRLPESWTRYGGAMIPLRQAEALWVKFDTERIDRQGDYPFAIKIATGKVNAVTGKGWNAGLHRKPQDYCVAPKQPWIDGYSVGKGVVRQFVAMPLGRGYSVEEQLTGAAEFGGIQFQVYPMKREVFERRFPVQPPPPPREDGPPAMFSLRAPGPRGFFPGMGIAPGGRITQQIHKDPYDVADWDMAHTSRCFVHLLNSAQWKTATGQKPPGKPPTARDYNDAGLPWFSSYKEPLGFLTGSAKLAAMETVADHARTIGDAPLEDNESVAPQTVIDISQDRKTGKVREGEW